MKWTCNNQYAGIAYQYIQQTGPCILWLHGYTMNFSVWQDLLIKFPSYSHLLIDIPGHGASSRIEDFKDLPSLAKVIIDLADIYSVKIIVGISFGGIIGIQMAIDAPGTYHAIILNSSPVGGGPIDPLAETKNIELIKLQKSCASKQELCDTWMQGPPDIFTGVKKHERVYESLKAVILKHKWKELENNSFAAFSGYNQVINGLSKINIPLHLLVGEEDMENIKRCNEIIKRSVKYSTRSYILGCGHLALFEQPDICSDIMKTYFKRLDSNGYSELS